MSTPIKWENANFLWDKAPISGTPYTWNDVQLIIKAAGDDYTQWEDKDKKRLIKLILKLNGKTITESKRKQIKQYKIKVNDIKLAIKNISNVEIMTENIKF